MSGTREGLELRADFSWDTVPLHLLKADGTWPESGVARATVFGSELTATAEGGVREVISFDGYTYNTSNRSLEITLSATVAPTTNDLTFNRLSLIRGGKSQGIYVGDFDDIANTFTITSSVPEAWSIGDRLVVHGTLEEFTVNAVSGTSGEILTLDETVTAATVGTTVSDASGTMMINYVFNDADVTVVQNGSTIFTFNGFSFAT